VTDLTTAKSMLYGVTGTVAALGAFFGYLALTDPASPAGMLAISSTAALGMLAGARLLWS
jgi:hypothetical protein